MRRAMRLAALLALAFAGTVSAAGERAADRVDGPTAPVRIADGITLFPGTFVAGRQPDGNSIVLRGPRGLVVFDTGRHAAHAQRIVAYAHARHAPVVAIVNSHWHLDHVSGNRLLRRAWPRAQIHASHGIDAALTGFLADSRRQARAALAAGTIPAAQRADVEGDMATIAHGRELLPTHYVERDEDLALAGRAVHLGLAPAAASAGDVWLYDPATRTLLSGDLVTLPAPLFDTACPSGWRRALDALDAVDFATLVPGHGAPMDHAAFRRWRDAFDRLLACVAGEAGNAACIDGWLHDAGDLVPATQAPLARTLLGYYLDTVLRAPASRHDSDCRGAAS